MSKRKFRVDTGRYGGELVIGTVSKEFVEYWRNKSDHKFSVEEHLTGLEWEDGNTDLYDKDCPKPYEDFSAWYECDDKEHINGAYADSDWYVTEITDEEDDWANNDSEKQFEPGQHLFGREAYHTDINDWDSDTVDLNEYDPVLCFHSGEKGSFGSYFIETDGEDFDPKKLTFSSVETNLGEIIELVWYNKTEVEANFDYNDTMGKGYYASVGYMNKKWHDNNLETFTKNLDEYYEDE